MQHETRPNTYIINKITLILKCKTSHFITIIFNVILKKTRSVVNKLIKFIRKKYIDSGKT